MALALVSCDDLKVRQENFDNSADENFLLLCEGLFNMNNGTLYSMNCNLEAKDIFYKVNNRKLGDTPNDMIAYGGKIYILTNVSNTLEIIDRKTFKSIKQVNFLEELSLDIQPRRLACFDGKILLTAFDGNFYVVDTVDFAIKNKVYSGSSPEGIEVFGDKIFVCNSGGMNAPNFDSTISVFDANNLNLIDKINVGLNPCKIFRFGDYLLVNTLGNYDNVKGNLILINPQNCQIEKQFDINCSNFTVDDDLVLGYGVDYNSNQICYFSIDKFGNMMQILPNYQVQMPYSIAKYKDKIYITDAKNYLESGDLAVFNLDFELIKTLKNVGLNPNKIIFVDDFVEEPKEEKPIEIDLNCSIVLEYCPAPSQFVNTVTSCYKDGYTYQDVKNEALQMLKNNQIITLGAMGGYILVKFDSPIKNILQKPDLQIDGNAFKDASEPAIVYVSKDENHNGIADDEFFQLKGSEFDNQINDYKITYTYKDDKITWIDNFGESGQIKKNPFHKQSYFPCWVESNTISFDAVRLPNNAINEDGIYKLKNFEYGYVDNLPNQEGGNLFYLEDAVDKNGNPIFLDEIDFVKIQTSINQYCGNIGETSSEISCIKRIINN